MKNRIYIVSLLIVVISSFNSCVPTVRRAYTKILKPCTTNDLAGKMLFFGPANNLGPGDVLRKQNNGGFGLSFRLPRLVPSQDEISRMIDVSNNGTCVGVGELNRKLAGKVSANDFVGNPEVSLTLNTAEKITTQMTNFEWVTLEQTIFEEKVDSLEDGNRLLISILENDTFVITRALKVGGLTVTYSFSSSVGAEAQAQFNQLDSELSGKWINSTTFELTVKSPFYIAGELRSYDETGLSASSTNFGEPINISENATVSTEIEEL